jgi:hypothetical protein
VQPVQAYAPYLANLMVKGQEVTVGLWGLQIIQWILKISLLIIMKATLLPKFIFVNSKGHHGISIQLDNVPNAINTPGGRASAY